MLDKILRALYKLLLLIIEPVILVITYNFCSKQNQTDKSLAIVKFDAIGDYLLFRNYIREVVESERFKDYRITLIGNEVCKEIAHYYDSADIDEFIWIKKSKFFSNILYRIKIARLIRQYTFDIAIQPTYWRELVFGESIMRFIDARQKIGSSGSAKFKFVNFIAKIRYDRLITATDKTMFEFLRNKEFFEQLLEVKLVTRFKLDPINSICTTQINEPYVILFVGASDVYRRWNLANFNFVGKWIEKNLGYKIVVCGLASDIGSHTIIPESFNNLLGKTSILELINLLSRAQFVVSNETSVPHISVGLGTKVFVISNGNDFGRFTEYPLSITHNYYAIYPQVIASRINDFTYLSKKYGYGSQLDINSISPGEVINKISCINCKLDL